MAGTPASPADESADNLSADKKSASPAPPTTTRPRGDVRVHPSLAMSPLVHRRAAFWDGELDVRRLVRSNSLPAELPRLGSSTSPRRRLFREARAGQPDFLRSLARGRGVEASPTPPSQLLRLPVRPRQIFPDDVVDKLATGSSSSSLAGPSADTTQAPSLRMAASGSEGDASTAMVDAAIAEFISAADQMQPHQPARQPEARERQGQQRGGCSGAPSETEEAAASSVAPALARPGDSALEALKAQTGPLSGNFGFARQGYGGQSHYSDDPFFAEPWRSMSDPGGLSSSAWRWETWRERPLPAALAQTIASTLSSVPMRMPTETFLCPICLENAPLVEKTMMSACTVDAHATCLGCMRTYLRLRIDDSRVDELRCPCSCGAEATEEELGLWLPKDIMEKYRRFSRMRADPRLRACPSCLGLRSPEVREDGTIVAEMYCTDCTLHFCFHHSNAHERGLEACAEYERSVIRQLVHDATMYGAKACPKCGAMTQKASGCNHMTCTCGANWCWVCERQLENVGWHYNPANPNGCMQFHDAMTGRRESKLMLVCRILSLPGMLASVVFLAAFTACLLAFCFIPCMFLFKEIGFKIWIGTAAVIVGVPFVLFSSVWAIFGTILWVLMTPCGAGEVHLNFFLSVPLMTALAICEGIIGPGPGRARALDP
eukprot:TRINITY_DN41468_c0_g1_i1.p1 TRINITY_DN41468_c0_g1~~TRINITY_DN41468_c0_g1_i1.p1  ORF type:complete len:662 (+),score=82.50 TRINITY_DN41468_c0_g1_i1:122-2107(+)